jgi:flagellar hook-associated protein 3 FlgL
LRVGLLTNDTATIRDTMEHLDEIIKNITMNRAKLSARVAGIDSAVGSTQRTEVQNIEIASQLEDADYAELWSNMAKEETALRSSLHAAQKLIQPTLLDFLR